MARHEDVLVAALDAALPGVPVVGGSAGDGLDFGQTLQILGCYRHRPAEEESA